MLDSINNAFISILKVFEHYEWLAVPFVLMCGGIFFMWVTKMVQFRYFGRALRNLFAGHHHQSHDEVNISPINAFMTGLASRVGTGNIAGVAVAIAIGGEGAVFWMWVAALIGMASAFAESSLAQLYKTKNSAGEFVGGPAFYLAQGLHLPKLGIIFSVLLAFTYGYAFNSIQANQISDTLHNIFSVNPYITGIFLALLTGSVILGSLKYISKISGKIVTGMSVIYILLGIFVLVVNFDRIPAAFAAIFRGAFGFDASAGGAIGVAIQYGVKRGLFSNEAGMGSAPNIAASASTLHPAEQGFVQMIGVAFDTLLICTFTALIVITAGEYKGSELAGAALTAVSVTHTLGEWSSYVMSTIIFLFAFSSIIGNYAYSLAGLKFFTDTPKVRLFFALSVMAFVFYGSVATADTVWLMGDVSMGLMVFVNMFAVVVLWKQVKVIITDYSRQVNAGKEQPVFNSDLYPQLRNKIYYKSIWSRRLDEEHDEEFWAAKEDKASAKN